MSSSLYTSTQSDIEAKNLSEEVIKEIQEKDKNTRWSILNPVQAWAKRDSNRVARVVILAWVALVTSILWLIIVILTPPTVAYSLITLVAVAFALFWGITSYLTQVQRYRSPQNGQHLALIGIIPVVIWWLLTIGVGIIFVPNADFQAEALLAGWGLLVVWILFATGLILPIWMVSLDNGVIRYYLPRMAEESRMEFVQQKHPEDTDTKRALNTFRRLKISDRYIKLLFAFRGDISLRNSIRTAIYDRFEQDLFDYREKLEREGKDIDPDLNLDLEFMDNIDEDRLKLEHSLIKFGLTDSVKQLREVEEELDLLLEHIKQPGVLPPPYQWIAPLDLSHPIWINGKYAPINTTVPRISTSKGAQFDLDVEFLILFNPENIRLPWSRRGMGKLEGIDKVSEYLNGLFSKAAARGTRPFFADKDFVEALTIITHNEYRKALAKQIIFFLARTFGTTIQVWSIDLIPRVDTATQAALNQMALDKLREIQSAETNQAGIREFLKTFKQNRNEIPPELLVFLRSQDKMPRSVRSVSSTFFNPQELFKDFKQPAPAPVEPKQAVQEQAPPPVSMPEQMEKKDEDVTDSTIDEAKLEDAKKRLEDKKRDDFNSRRI